MKTGFNPGLFLKAQLSSLAASVVDFGVYGILLYGFGIWYVAASVAGITAGGVVNFLMGRQWAFAGGAKRARVQAFRFVLVWNGNLLLNAAGVYLVKELLHLEPTFSKILVSLLVGFTYNFLLQKNFVFK